MGKNAQPGRDCRRRGGGFEVVVFGGDGGSGTEQRIAVGSSRANPTIAAVVGMAAVCGRLRAGVMGGLRVVARGGVARGHTARTNRAREGGRSRQQPSQ